MYLLGNLIIIIWFYYSLVGGSFAAVFIWLFYKRINTFSRFIALWFSCIALIFIIMIFRIL
ncbi:hypothetical protein B9037_014115 [Klebsiella aerogenes]|nr:hypothetical protein B9037_014115 [Klebsiella aerogenes]